MCIYRHAGSANTGAIVVHDVVDATTVAAAEDAALRDEHDVPGLRCLQDAVAVAECNGWRLDSDAEEDDAQQLQEELEDDDGIPKARPRMRRQPPPPRPPASAAAAPVSKQFTGVRHAHWVFKVLHYGELCFDTRLRIVSAHCSCVHDHGVCRLNRTTRRGRSLMGCAHSADKRSNGWGVIYDVHAMSCEKYNVM